MVSDRRCLYKDYSIKVKEEMISVRLTGFAIFIGAKTFSAIVMVYFLPFFDSKYINNIYREIKKENYEKDEVIKSLATIDQKLG